MKAARDRDRPNIGAASAALMALFGIAEPTPEQTAGALLLACVCADIHALTKDG